MPAPTSIRRTADAVVHLRRGPRALGSDPDRSAAARIGGLARAQHLTPERRREIGRKSCLAGLAALAEKHAAANRRMDANVADLATAIREAAKRRERFSVEAFIAAKDWPNEGGIRDRFKATHAMTPRAFYEARLKEARTS